MHLTPHTSHDPSNTTPWIPLSNDVTNLHSYYGMCNYLSLHYPFSTSGLSLPRVSITAETPHYRWHYPLNHIHYPLGTVHSPNFHFHSIHEVALLMSWLQLSQLCNVVISFFFVFLIKYWLEFAFYLLLMKAHICPLNVF